MQVFCGQWKNCNKLFSFRGDSNWLGFSKVLIWAHRHIDCRYTYIWSLSGPIFISSQCYIKHSILFDIFLVFGNLYFFYLELLRRSVCKLIAFCYFAMASILNLSVAVGSVFNLLFYSPWFFFCFSIFLFIFNWDICYCVVLHLVVQWLCPLSDMSCVYHFISLELLQFSVS